MSQSPPMTDERRAHLAATKGSEVAAMSMEELRGVRSEIFNLLKETELKPAKLLTQEPWILRFVSKSQVYEYRDRIRHGATAYRNESLNPPPKTQQNIPDVLYGWILDARRESPHLGARELLDVFEKRKLPGWPLMTLAQMREALRRLKLVEKVPDPEGPVEVMGTAYGRYPQHVLAYDVVEIQRKETAFTLGGKFLPKIWIIAVVDLFSRGLLWITFHTKKPRGRDFVAALYEAMRAKDGIGYRGLCVSHRRDNERVNMTPEIEYFFEQLGSIGSESPVGYP